jgi:hypothetical protein
MADDEVEFPASARAAAKGG